MTLRTVMFLANLVIAIDYLLLAVYWSHHLRVPLRLRRRDPDASMGSIVVVLSAVLFFIGCAHTHIDVLLAMRSGEEIWDHWLDWYNVVSHIFQGLAGATFAAGATYWIHVRIFDRKQYDAVITRARETSEAIMSESERELQEAKERLALMEQVVRLRQSDIPPQPGKDRRRRSTDGDDA